MAAPVRTLAISPAQSRAESLAWRLLLALAILAAASQACFALASPAARPRLPEIIMAYLVFPAGREPDAQGRFEIEVYCKAHFRIDGMSVRIGHAERIKFAPGEASVVDANTLLLFQGPAKAGEEHAWRLNAVLSPSQGLEGDNFPAGLALYVDYAFPHRAVARVIEADPELAPETRRRMLEWASRRATDEWSSIVRALPVQGGMRR